MTKQYPLVSVLIITFNRSNSLDTILNKLFSQDYKNLDVIVIDNASTDDTEGLIKQKYPQITFIKSPSNIGIQAFNIGLRIVRGDYLLLLDDDSYPLENTILTGVNLFKEKKDVGIVAYEVLNEKLNFIETRNIPKNNTTYFFGGGALIRKSIVTEVGFYDELIFMYNNEVDLSIRVLEKGYKILYLPDCRVIHMPSEVTDRNSLVDLYKSEFRYYHVTVGHFIFLTKHFSIRWVVIYSLKWILNRIIIAIRFKLVKTFFKALFRFAKIFHKVVASRKVVSKEIQKLYNYGKIPIVDRDFYPNFEKKKIMSNALKLFRVH